MTIQNITYYSPAEAETLIRQALGKTPPALDINGEDVIYDFAVTAFEATAS